MNYKLNLASNPLRNRGLPWVVAVILATVSVVALFFVLTRNTQVNRQTATVKTDVDTLNREIAEIKKQDQEISNSLSPQQKRDWHAANGLISRKRFPWSRLFADLEGVLPGNVRVNRISVRDIALQGSEMVSEFELAVQTGNTDLVIDNMLQRMENGGAFQADLVNQTLLKGKNEQGTEFTLRVRYRPRNGVAATRNDSLAQNGGTP